MVQNGRTAETELDVIVEEIQQTTGCRRPTSSPVYLKMLATLRVFEPGMQPPRLHRQVAFGRFYRLPALLRGIPE
jgi:hypothetical protein